MNQITIPSGSTPISVNLANAAQALGEAATALFQVVNSVAVDGTGNGPSAGQTDFANGLQALAAQLKSNASFYQGQGC